MTPFKRNTQLSSLQQEIIGLQALQSQMTMRVSALKHNRTTAEFAESFKGKAIGRTWAVYCVIRVISSAMNIVSPPSSAASPSSYGDIIAHVLAYLVSILPLASNNEDSRGFHVDVPSLSRQISLALVGIIILSSVRVVLRGVTKAFRITSRSVSASLMLLVLAQLMGIYLLSTLVQLRTMFPPSTPSVTPAEPSSLPTNATDLSSPEGPALPPPDTTNLFLTLPEYSLFGGLFDWSFLLGAFACVVSRWVGSVFGADDMET